jgi:hypothetical protein
VFLRYLCCTLHFPILANIFSNMATLTTDQLKNLSFGYLRGADLVRYSAPQLLIKQYEVDPDSLQQGADIAYSELISLLNTRYALASEFEKQGFTNAAGVALVDTGAVTAINVTFAGTNYGSVPVVTITGTGSGATAEATVLNGIVTGITVTAPGTGYTVAPTVTISGGSAPDARTQVFVKLSAIFAVRNALGNLQSVGEWMRDNFTWADKTVLALRQGQQGMPTVNQSPTTTYGSPASVIDSSFLTLG